MYIKIGPGGLRAPCVLACAMRSLAIVFTIVQPRSGLKAEDGGEEEERKRERKKERLNNGENNGQATHGARKHAWRTQAAWANLLSSPIWLTADDDRGQGQLQISGRIGRWRLHLQVK